MEGLLNTAPCGFFRLADDGTVLLANETLLGVLGYDRAVLVGRRVDGILGPGARIFYQTHVFPLLRMHGRVDEVYLSLRSASGADVPVLLNAARREHEGRPVNDCVVMTMRQRSQFEDELLQARKAAEEATRAKDRFLSMMSHDLRAPLSGISMAAEILASGADGPVTDLQRRDLERIQQASQYVLRLVTDILDFARLDAGRADLRARPVALEEALTQAGEMVGHLMRGAQLSFTCEPCPPGAAALADPDRLQQVLLNLLSNAANFTDPGGLVSVSCEQAGHRVHLHVRDTGRGISADQLERIFDPFVQAHEPAGGGGRRAEGTGLGLAISRELTRAMGGELTVESVLGEGSRFTVTLPAAGAAAQDPTGDPV